jgi:hypothetical protein
MALGDAFELHDRRRRHRATSFDRASVLLVEDNEGEADLVTDYLSEICGALVSRATRLGRRHPEGGRRGDVPRQERRPQ